MTMGDFARARRDYDHLIEEDGTDEDGRAARLNRANLDADSGEFERARKAYSDLLAEDLRDTEVRFSRAILELRLGRPALAEKDLSVLLVTRHPTPKKRGEYLAERRRRGAPAPRTRGGGDDGGHRRRRRAIQPFPAYRRLEQRAFLAARRYDLLHLERPEDLALFPFVAAAWMRGFGPRPSSCTIASPPAEDEKACGRGLLSGDDLLRLGEPKGALAAADRAVSLSRFDTEPRLVRARVRAFAGDRRGAAAEVQEVLANHPEEPDPLELRASLRLAGGDPRGAIEDYDSVLA